MNDGPTPDDLRAKVFEDRETPGNGASKKWTKTAAMMSLRCSPARMPGNRLFDTRSGSSVPMTKSGSPRIPAPDTQPARRLPNPNAARQDDPNKFHFYAG
jgi:hypothetical protein